MKERFVVTGGSGFIGSNVVRALNERGHEEILVVDETKRPNLDRIRYAEFIDKADFRAMVREDRLPRIKTVFHLGACSSTTVTDEAFLEENNTRYTRDLCEWCLKHDVRFIQASSAATYGDGSKGYSDEDENTPSLQPLNAYGWSKQRFDLQALEAGWYDRIVGLKYFNVYGPGEDHKEEMRSVVHKAYGQIMEKGRLGLFRSYRPEYRDGEQVRDFIHVDDAVAVTLFFHDHPEVSGLFNCGTGKARSWLDLGRAVFAAMGREAQIDFIEMPESIREKYQYHTEADLAKLRRAGYDKPFLSLEEGVSRYVREYLSGS